MDVVPGRDKHVSWEAAGAAARSVAAFGSERSAIGFEYAGDKETPVRVTRAGKKHLKCANMRIYYVCAPRDFSVAIWVIIGHKSGHPADLFRPIVRVSRCNAGCGRD